MTTRTKETHFLEEEIKAAQPGNRATKPSVWLDSIPSGKRLPPRFAQESIDYTKYEFKKTVLESVYDYGA